MSEPSIHEANKLLRVLNGERRKYTCRVHCPDGKIVEFQAEKQPQLTWNDHTRSLLLMSDGYSGSPIMEWVSGSVLLVEENPKL